MIELIQLIIKNVEHLQLFRHGLNDDITSELSCESFITEMRRKTRISYLNKQMIIIYKGIFFCFYLKLYTLLVKIIRT
jgi:hypothetical protein